jgi:hypothetical protein
MTFVIDTTLKRRLSAKLAAGFALSAFLALGTFVASAHADGHPGPRDRGHDSRYDRDDHRDHGRSGWGGGYYRAPPVVYGSPYYAPPPVVYGPTIGVYIPGINIGIH